MTFKKGQSGNPYGAPRGRHLSTILMKKLKEHAKTPKGEWIVDEDKNFKTFGEVMIDRLVMEASFARKYNPLVSKIVMAYIDGDPEQFLDITSGGKELQSVGESNIMELAKKISAELKDKKT